MPKRTLKEIKVAKRTQKVFGGSRTGTAMGGIEVARLPSIDTRLNIQTAPQNLDCYKCKNQISEGDSMVIWDTVAWIGPVHTECAEFLLKKRIQRRKEAQQDRMRNKKRSKRHRRPKKKMVH